MPGAWAPIGFASRMRSGCPDRGNSGRRRLVIQRREIYSETHTRDLRMPGRLPPSPTVNLCTVGSNHALSLRSEWHEKMGLLAAATPVPVLRVGARSMGAASHARK